jgi:hypothetical protein
MRLAAVVLIFIVTTSPSLFAQQPSQTALPVEPSPRYQLFAASTDEPLSGPEKRVFLIDTQTGDVWEYQPPFVWTSPDGKKTVTAASFQKIPESFPAPARR